MPKQPTINMIKGLRLELESKASKDGIDEYVKEKTEEYVAEEVVMGTEADIDEMFK